MPPRPSVLPVALLVFVAALLVYLRGMAPGLLWGDSAEMQILAAIGGVAHPTGYPLFTGVAHLFTLVGHGEPAQRANLVSAVFAAATLALLVCVLVHRGVSRIAAVAAAIAWGLSFTFWSTAQRAEVYSLASFVALGALWCTLQALEHGGRRARLAAGVLLGLTLAGHMAFAPVIAVAGLTLAWRVPRQGAWLADEAALLAAFLLGLSPYAYLVWADTTGHGLSYLKLVDLAQWPTHPPPPEFRPPLARFWWLLTSRNEYPRAPFHHTLRFFAKNVSDTACLLALYDWGPVPLAVTLAGLRRRLTTNAFEARLLAVFAAVSILFSIVTSGDKILAVFLIPCMLVLAVLAGHGFEALRETLARRSAQLAGVVVLALPVASMLVANAIRLATYDHPVGPLRSRMVEEDEIRETDLFPSMAAHTEPRRFVESAARAIPDSSLVICEWREFMAILYLQRVERRRTDLTVQPSGYPTLLQKVDEWQSRHPLATHPVVVVTPLGLMSKHLTSADTLHLATGQPIVVTRTPLRTAVP